MGQRTVTRSCAVSVLSKSQFYDRFGIGRAGLVYLALSESKFYDHMVLDQAVTFMINQHCLRNHSGLALPERKVYDQLVMVGALELVTIRALLLSTLSKNHF